MAKEKKVADLTETAEKIREVVKNAGAEGILFSDIKVLVPEANPSQLTALVKRGLVSAEQTEVEVLKKVKSKVNRYTFKGE